MRQHTLSSRRTSRPTHVIDLAQAVVRIATVNSKIAAISKQLRSLHSPKNDSKAPTLSTQKSQARSDDPVKAEAISALLEAFDFDDLQVIAGNRNKTQDMPNQAGLRARARKMQRLLRMGHLVRKIVQEKYPLSWERLLQS